jgi:hypothetical protein
MATALDFPPAPQVGDKYPVPAVVGQPQYTWDGYKWVTAGPQVASALPASATPLMDATPARVGISDKYAREDHVHPTDTSQIALNQAVRYDIAQTATAAQRSQARANVDVTRKNYVVNGAMMISQENGSGALSASASFPADQFYVSFSTTGTVSFGQVSPPTPTPAGSPNRIRVTVTTADASITAAKYLQIVQRIEGMRVADLKFGLAAARTITVQFGCKGPAGTYCVVVTNGAGNRSYVSEYVIAAGEANTDVIKSVTVPGDVTGTWAVDYTLGFIVTWGLMTGPTWQQVAGSWGTVNAAGSSNQFNFMGTLNNVFELFDVSLTEGNAAPPFMVPDYASELLACQRYYYKRPDGLVGYYTAVTAAIGWTRYPVYMRTAPTLSATGGNPINVSGGMTYDAVTEKSARRFAMMAAGGQLLWDDFIEVANARL